jgi:hypothetical protein
MLCGAVTLVPFEPVLGINVRVLLHDCIASYLGHESMLFNNRKLPPVMRMMSAIVSGSNGFCGSATPTGAQVSLSSNFKWPLDSCTASTRIAPSRERLTPTG